MADDLEWSEEYLNGTCQGCGKRRRECLEEDICKSKCKGGWEALIRDVTQWQRETFPGDITYAKQRHLAEEVRHLAEVKAGIRDGTVAGEIADCLILLMGIADLEGVDMLSAVWEKLEINKKRKWGPPNEWGVTHHKDE